MGNHVRCCKIGYSPGSEFTLWAEVGAACEKRRNEYALSGLRLEMVMRRGRGVVHNAVRRQQPSVVAACHVFIYLAISGAR